LRRLGIEVDSEHVYTCATATARFLAQQKPKGTAFVIGEGGHKIVDSIADLDPVKLIREFTSVASSPRIPVARPARKRVVTASTSA
jgi:ribonucleotide monophosphatase NagD (HAD superfamily)